MYVFGYSARHSSETMENQSDHARRLRDVADAARKRLQRSGAWQIEEEAEREVRRRARENSSHID